MYRPKIFSLFFFLGLVNLLSAQISQITIKVRSQGNLLDSVNVDIRTPSFRDDGWTGTNGRYSTSINLSDLIVPGEQVTVICYKAGYQKEIHTENIGEGEDDLIIDINLEPSVNVDPIIYVKGEVLDRSNGRALTDVEILVLTKKKEIKTKTRTFGEFQLELLPNNLLNKNEVEIRLKKENYINQQFTLDLTTSKSQSIYLNREPKLPSTSGSLSGINYIPIAGNFYRNENLSAWIYSIGLLSGIGVISYSSIQIPALEKDAMEAISSSGRSNYLSRAAEHRNLRKGAYVFSGVVLGASLIHCIIKSKKLKKRNRTAPNIGFQFEIDSGAIGLTMTF